MKLKKIGLFATIIFAMMNVNAQNFAGDWKGTLSIQSVNLELIFHISEKDGVYTSTLDVPAQSAFGIPIEKTEVNGNDIKISAGAMGATYAGTLDTDGISGNFSQGGMTFPLALKEFESKLPGNPNLVSSDEALKKLSELDKGNYKYKVADYFARPKASSFQLSPNGKYMSYFEKDDKNKNHVYVKNVATGKVARAIEEKEELIKGYGWINDERLFYVMDNGGNENYHIYATNVDGFNTKDLTPFDSVQASILNISERPKRLHYHPDEQE
ncbi:MAG: hypothetical protein QM751_00455 [Paludibacteraceae bacterium]